jgi:hypothetical protein
MPLEALSLQEELEEGRHLEGEEERGWETVVLYFTRHQMWGSMQECRHNEDSSSLSICSSMSLKGPYQMLGGGVSEAGPRCIQNVALKLLKALMCGFLCAMPKTCLPACQQVLERVSTSACGEQTSESDV